MKKSILGFCLLVGLLGTFSGHANQIVAAQPCGSVIADIVIMLDRTGSVSATERAAEADAAKDLITTIETMGGGHKVAIGRFNDDVADGTDAEVYSGLSSDYAALRTAVDTALASTGGGTNLEDAIEIAKGELLANGTADEQFIILISDGQSNRHDTTAENAAEGDDDVTGAYNAALDAAEEAKAAGITIFTIAFDAMEGTAVAVQGRQLLAAVASNASDDDSVDAVDDAEKIFENTDGDNFFISPADDQITAVLAQVGGTILCDDADQCTNDICDPATHFCVFTPIDTDSDGDIDCHDGCPADPDKDSPGQCGCGMPDTDTDGDGTADCIDGCPVDGQKTQPGVCGCGVSDVDTDGDQTADCNDQCPSDPAKVVPGACGCGESDVDTDEDGVADCNDSCPSDPQLTNEDSDGDGVVDCEDGCSADPAKTQPGQCGCGVSDADSDGDGYADCFDGCPTDPAKQSPGVCGCNEADSDSDGDGYLNCYDGCPDDSAKVNPGQCGCGVPDPYFYDTAYSVKATYLPEGDYEEGTTCDDYCPNSDIKVWAGQCGCDVADTDTDSDGVADCNDLCPTDSTKTEPGICGCNVSDVDTDEDGTADCNDACSADYLKVEIGACGCGVADVDGDADGVADCSDLCPNDPAKSAAGLCGCGTADVDTDSDGVANCTDQCPADAAKSAPGVCGCGEADADTDADGVADCNDNCSQVANADQADADANGIGDACEADIAPIIDEGQNQDQGSEEPLTPQVAPLPGFGVAGGPNCQLNPLAVSGDFHGLSVMLLGFVGLLIARFSKRS